MKKFDSADRISEAKPKASKKFHGTNGESLAEEERLERAFDAIGRQRYERREEVTSVLKPHGVLKPLSAEEQKKILLVTDLANQEIDWSENLLGSCWLERTCGNLIVAPSGVGKSCLDMQAAILWACGKAAFGIGCEKPLKQWVFQHEDRMNDLRWMSRIMHHLKLTPKQIRLVKENLRLQRLVGVQGKEAIDAMSRYCNFFPPDLIHINPLATYMKGKFQSEDETNEYLYHQIDPMLREFDCGLLGILHTAKTLGKDYSEMDDPTQRQYLMSGRANWTNWGRGIIDVMPVDSTKKVFAFNASKRGELIGWSNLMTVWKWAPRAENGDRILLWLPGDSEDEFTAIKGAKVQSNDLLVHIPFRPGFTMPDQLHEQVNRGRDQQNRIGIKRVRTMLQTLVNEGKVFEERVQLPQGGQPQARFSRVK